MKTSFLKRKKGTRN